MYWQIHQKKLKKECGYLPHIKDSDYSRIEDLDEYLDIDDPDEIELDKKQAVIILPGGA